MKKVGILHYRLSSSPVTKRFRYQKMAGTEPYKAIIWGWVFL